MKEIEYKYLVNKKLWNTIKKPKPDFITQGYISKNKDCTSRIRINNNRAFITIKGKNKGIVRQEFQYEIPLNEAIWRLEVRVVYIKDGKFKFVLIFFNFSF